MGMAFSVFWWLLRNECGGGVQQPPHMNVPTLKSRAHLSVDKGPSQRVRKTRSFFLKKTSYIFKECLQYF